MAWATQQGTVLPQSYWEFIQEVASEEGKAVHFEKLVNLEMNRARRSVARLKTGGRERIFVLCYEDEDPYGEISTSTYHFEEVTENQTFHGYLEYHDVHLKSLKKRLEDVFAAHIMERLL